MRRALALLLVTVCALTQARPVTLAWDNPGWPVGTTVELEANGVTVSGITGTQATLEVPLVPGEGLFARARAHADGFDPSEWAALTVTYPRDPVSVWADRTEPDVTPVAISNPVLLGQGSGNEVNSYNVTLSTNPSAGDLIVVMMVFADTTSSVGDSAVSDNKGHTYTRQTQSAHYLYSGWYARSEIWTTVCTTTGGTFTVTINPPVTTGMYSSAAVAGVSGQATSFVDTAESSTGASSSPSANIANLTDAGDCVLGVMTYNWHGVTIAPGSGWTQLVEIDEPSSTYQALSSIWRKPGATGAYDPAWTLGDGLGWVASGIAIKPSSGAVNLSVSDSSHGHAADGGLALTQAHVLAASDAAHAQTVDGNLALSQGYTLSAADAAHAQAVDGDLSLSQGYALTTADAAHAQTVDGDLALTQANVLAAADAAHAHTADGNLALTQAHVLAAADAAHAHTVDGDLSLFQGYALSASDAAHAHTVDGDLALTQAHLLSAADSAHAHTVDSPTLAPGTNLATADSAHAHTVDGDLAITQAHVLAAADAAHAQTADGDLALTQDYLLAAADSAHAHTADAPELSLASLLSPSDSAHAQTVDGDLALVQAHLLAVSGSLHAQAVDSLELAVAYLLAPADSAHAHGAESPTLTAAGPVLIVSDTLHAQLAERVGLTVDGGSGRVFVVSAAGRLFAVAAARPRTFSVAAAPRVYVVN